MRTLSYLYMSLLFIPIIFTEPLAAAKDEETVDFVIVGAGTAGSVLANRLSKCFTVRVIESGRDDTRLPELLPIDLPDPLPNKENNQWSKLIRVGFVLLTNLFKGFDTWQFQPLNKDGKNATTVHYPRGSSWGGSTAHNYCVLLRGIPEIYDEWAAQGNTLWSYDKLIPFFKKIENRSQINGATGLPYFDESRGVDVAGGFNPATESKTGKIYLVGGFINDPLYNALTASAQTPGLYPGAPGGFPVDVDPNSTDQIQYLTNIPFTLFDQLSSNYSSINPYPTPATYPTQEFDGLDGATSTFARSFAAPAYLYPVLHRKNLKIISEALATKILFEQKDGQKPKAIGVEYLEGWNIYQTGRQMNTGRGGLGGTPQDAKFAAKKAKKCGVKRIFARKAVIIAGGVFNSPQLLLLSGVGPKKELKKLGIEVIKDLPGVGKHLLDHPLTTIAWQTNGYTFNLAVPNKSTPLTFFLFKSAINKQIPDFWLQMAPAPPSLNEGGILDPFGADIPFSTAMRPPTKYINPDDDKYVPPLTLEINPATGDTTSQYMFAAFAQTSGIKAEGYVKLVSKDPTKPPKIVLNLLQTPEDINSFVVAFRDTVVPFVQNLAGSGFFTGWIEPSPANFLSNGTVMLPDKSNFDVAKYTAYLQTNIQTEYHGSGTCKMGPRKDPLAVVSQRGRVHGVENLIVCDASIIPVIPTANIQAATYTIGERISELILEDFKKRAH